MSDIAVSMLLVVRNSEEYISSALYSLLRQGYDHSEFEIIIVDGESEDLTLSLAKQILSESKVNYLILNNKAHSLASGWNIGIKNAKGKYIVRPDAHSELLNNYVKNGVDKLKKDPLLACVGGILRTQSKDIFRGVIAKILSNPVGVGGSLFRIGVSKDTYSDTAVFAVYKKSVFDKCGYFDESLKRNQDVDFHKRVSACGYKLLTSPSMVANYYSRDTFIGFVAQGFRNGFWVIASGGYFLRHLAPFAFVLLLFFSVFVSLKLTLMILAGYLVVTTYFFIKRNKFSILDVLLFDIFIFSLHISYGFGSASAIIYAPLKKFIKFS
jgi:glycosyltransferase involved in cell wall biosynthesis